MPMDFARCCHSGKEASGPSKQAGNVDFIGQLRVYQSRPVPSSPPLGILLLLPDGFGLVPHNFILADSFAAVGWHVIIPDYYEGEPLPLELLRRNPDLPIEDHDWPEEQKVKLKELDLAEWLKRHPHNRVERLLRHVLPSIRRELPGKSVSVIGYCFGGKHAIRMSTWPEVRAAAAFHPSFVTSQDTEGLSQSPLFVGYAENDQMVSPTLMEDLKGWLVAKKADFDSRVYPAMKHGFAARPDTDDSKIKEQYLRAFQDSVAFLKSHV